MLMRHVALAVELCERAVEMTGRVLPGPTGPGAGRAVLCAAGLRGGTMQPPQLTMILP